MNCCEQSGTGMGCNQGRTCPVRATRDAGACTPPEPEDLQLKDDMLAFMAMVIFAYTLICAGLGYLWGAYGQAIESFLWALAARLS